MARRWVILLHAVLEIFLSLLAVFGLFSLGWLAFGRILAPRDFYAPAYAVVPARGDGAALEQTVRALLWLRAGELRRYTVVIADDGLGRRQRPGEPGAQGDPVPYGRPDGVFGMKRSFPPWRRTRN